jgi:uncharacterized protein DUF1570
MRKAVTMMIAVMLWPMALHGAPRTASGPRMQRFETKYYILYTDVSIPEAQEAAIRMTKMAEEYHNRTSGFSGVIRNKFPFYLYRNRDDYEAAGGLPGTAGLFDGGTLMAVAGARLDDRVWHVVQHEGFHQFAKAVIGGDRPTWVNEGLAEYFGEALFTGDGFVSGIIPQWRLKRIRDEFDHKQFMSNDRMMKLSHEAWNEKISLANYDQAWSMVQFLAHGQNGKYQKAFAQFMIELSKNQPSYIAWNDNFGGGEGNVRRFEDRWQTYWTQLPDDPTASLYSEATAATLSSFLTRAVQQGQSFASYEEFAQAARNGDIKISSSNWLPPAMLQRALADADQIATGGATWSLTSDGSTLKIHCTLKDGPREPTGNGPANGVWQKK